MPTVATKHIVEVPDTGINIDLPIGSFKVKALSVFGPWHRVDVAASVDALVDAFFTGASKPTKLRGSGENDDQIDERGATYVFAAPMRLAMRTMSGNVAGTIDEIKDFKQHNGSGPTVTLKKSTYVEITSPTPFSL